MKSLNLMWGLVLVVLLADVGCGPTDITFTKKPSYADLVVIYNAEVETLDKLEAKRKTAIAEYFSQVQGTAMKAAVSSIRSGESQKIPSNPDEALDQAVAAAEMQAQLQSGLLDGLDLSSELGESAEDYPQELKDKLKDLEAEIAKQEARVQRAKDARDAAESQ